MNAKNAKVGVIGCGRISPVYLKNASRFGLDIVACADLNMDAARQRAAEFYIPKVLTPEKLLADPDIEYVLNLTIPQAHYPIAMAALENGKCVYNEKPLAVTRDEAARLVDLAKRKNLRLGCAPDTFLGAGLQTARRWIDAGKIGTPVAAEILFRSGPARHSLDSHLVRAGGGILFDMGPYYVTAMVALLGPVKRLTGSCRKLIPAEILKKHPDAPSKWESYTHVSGVMDMANNVVVDFSVSNDICEWYHIHFKIHGTEGTMLVPDPNAFGGDVVFAPYGQEKERVKTQGAMSDDSRIVGLADMAAARAANQPHRVSESLAYHVQDVMCSLVDSSEQGKHITLQSTMERPMPFPIP